MNQFTHVYFMGGMLEMDQWCHWHIDGLVWERRKSSALAMEIRLSCTNPSIYTNVPTSVHNRTHNMGSYVQVIACCLFSANTSSKPRLIYPCYEPREIYSVETSWIFFIISLKQKLKLQSFDVWYSYYISVDRYRIVSVINYRWVSARKT